MRTNERVLLGNDEERRLEEAPARRALGGEADWLVGRPVGLLLQPPVRRPPPPSLSSLALPGLLSVVLFLSLSHRWLCQITLYQQPLASHLPTPFLSF